jgi:hypothetical protein
LRKLGADVVVPLAAVEAVGAQAAFLEPREGDFGGRDPRHPIHPGDYRLDLARGALKARTRRIARRLAGLAVAFNRMRESLKQAMEMLR